MWDEKTQEIWIVPGRIDKLMERTCVLLLVMLFIGCNLGYALLPNSIPLHFNVHGYADTYTSKAYFFVLPSIGIFIYLAITLMNTYMERGHFKQPVSAERHYRLSSRMILLVKLAVLVACTIQMGETVRLSYRELGRPGWPATLWEAIFLLTPLVYYLVHLRRIKRGRQSQA